MKYILYCRKSTDSEDRQVFSLDSQEKELLNIAKKNNLQVIKVFKESRTAKEAGRPIFNEVINMITAGKADAILCWKLDRLARNFLDGGLIMDMLQKGIIKEIRTYEAIHLPNETSFIMAMQFGMANQFSRDLSVNVKRGNRAKLEQGGWPSHAPFGYLNDKANKTIVVDPNKSKYVLRAFEMYASGTASFEKISDILYAEGLRTSAGKKVHKGYIHNFITDPFYYGMMVREGKYYPGNHEPLITKELFDQVEQARFLELNPRPKSERVFPLRGFLKCEQCGCALTAALKKGHQYYFCTNGKGICDQHRNYLREIYLDEKLVDVFKPLHLTEQKIDLLYQAAKERVGADTEYLQKSLDTLGKQLESLKAKESKLLDTFLADQISKEVYDAKVLELSNAKTSTEKQFKELKSRQPLSTLEPIRDIFIQGSKATDDYSNADDQEKRNLVSELLWNLSIKDRNIAKVSYKSPFDILAKLPKNADFLTLCRRQDLHLRPRAYESLALTT